MSHTLDFFAQPGWITTPGQQAQLLDHLPGDIRSLCRVIQGVMIHCLWADRYGVQLSEQRQAEVYLRFIFRQLERLTELDARPLTEAREPDKRLVGTCRDFAVLLTTLLRYQGVPARARCGFARYFKSSRFEDHWICEYWNATSQRWVLVDAQLDALQVAKLGVRFDPLDIPRDAFIMSGQAWRMHRAGVADPDTLGLFEVHGPWFVRSNFVRDIASLNKVELLPWDAWGIMEARAEDLSAADQAVLDQLARLTCGDVPEFDQVRELYEAHECLRVPETIRCYMEGGVQTIDLVAA